MHRNPTARLFVAIDPPEDVREQLASWARAAVGGRNRREGDRPRILDPELLHVTLHFLGNRPTEEIEEIAAHLAACGGPAGALSVGAPVWLPPRRPRALAVELHEEQGWLADVQESVVAAMGELDDRQSDEVVRHPSLIARRNFRPHVTVARMRSGAAPRERALPPTPALSFVPSEMVLYRSWLSRDGASYESLASYAIG